jgi:peptidoglycan/LPS O-acetylase OafA/YrhL
VPSLGIYPHAGFLGVDAFFVLSGFLITGLLLREQMTSGRVGIGGFYQRRALRLLPALIVLLGVHVVYTWIHDASMAIERHSDFAVLFYYSNTWLLRTPMTPSLGPLWSLAVEEQFYLVWPLVVVLFLGIRRRTSIVVSTTVVLIATVCVYRAMLWAHGTSRFVVYTRVTTRADALLMGALLAQLWVRGLTPKRGITWFAWPALALYLYFVFHGISGDFLHRGGYTLVALMIAVVILAVLETSWKVNAVLRFRPLREIGRLSYGLYIWHLFVFYAVLYYAHTASDAARVTLALTVTALACVTSWLFVEQPFLQWKVRLDRRADAPSHDAVTTGIAPERHRRGGDARRGFPRLASAIVLIALLVGGTGLWLTRHDAYEKQKPADRRFPRTQTVVTMPNEVGETVFEAAHALVDEHLNIVLVGRADPAPRGIVVEQSVAPGTRVHEGTLVRIVYSR